MFGPSLKVVNNFQPEPIEIPTEIISEKTANELIFNTPFKIPPVKYTESEIKIQYRIIVIK